MDKILKTVNNGQANNNQVLIQILIKISLFITKVSDKIYTHFKTKYPSTIDASGFNKNTITTIINQSIKKEPLNEKSINKIIEIIDHKFKMTINSDNRKGAQLQYKFIFNGRRKKNISRYIS